MFAKKIIAKTEAFFKGLAFDCHTCGQCVLSKTKLICPMSCPKGLRNGPCGGTTDNKCEVYPDRDCVWVRIHNHVSKGDTSLPELISSPDSSLFHTSSYLNYLDGSDQAEEKSIKYLDLGDIRTMQPVHTQSILEKKLKNGKFVVTTEMRSPRSSNIDHIHKVAKIFKDKFDAVNVTAYLNGKPSLPSPRVAKELQAVGIEAIAQSTCRDHTKTSFVSELIANDANGVHNVLCLTGDSYMGTPKIKQVFDMDSSLMLYEARYLRENSRIHFTGESLKNNPRLFLGGAINPFTTPTNVPIRRLKQKAAAGADFIQTQLVFDIPKFKEFMRKFCEERLNEELFLIAGIPVVISNGALEMLPHVPGVVCPEATLNRLRKADDVKKEGVLLAKELVQEVKNIPGVNGVHLMLLGTDHSVLPDLIPHGEK